MSNDPILLEYSYHYKCIPDYWKATQFDATIAFHLFKISILVIERIRKARLYQSLSLNRLTARLKDRRNLKAYMS